MTDQLDNIIDGGVIVFIPFNTQQKSALKNKSPD